jgi:hypothetical protein
LVSVLFRCKQSSRIAPFPEDARGEAVHYVSANRTITVVHFSIGWPLTEPGKNRQFAVT